jgi:glutamate-1-semialdehyde 2,1-aminomutase
MHFDRSEQLFQRACRVLVGGVNSPVRAFRAVGGTPIFIERGKGAYLYDADGNQYVDYVLSWGPLILGHAYPAVVEAVVRAAEKGSSFGAPTENEILLAERIRQFFPSMEMVRLVSSGTEATLSAVRVARGFTGRDLVIKFEGCYHGHVDSLMVKGGSGLATFATPSSAGVPSSHTATTIVVPYNDTEAVAKVFEEHGERIACVIVEPVAGNMGVVLPQPGFLETLRNLTQHYGALLIFDEVMTGFRVALGGAQSVYRITPDLTTLGKVIGGGLPVGAYGGKREIMECVSPLGPVYQAGTLSGNPLATAAGLATLNVLETPGLFASIEKRAQMLAEGFRGLAEELGIPTFTTQIGTMGCTFFVNGPVTNWQTAEQADTQQYARFFWGMVRRGCYVAPSQFEAWFLSAAHSEADIEKTLEAAREALKESLN